MNRFLPKLFRYAFAVLAVLAALAAVCITAAMLIDPELPRDARFGPRDGEFLGQPASFALQPDTSGQGEPALYLRAFNGNVTMTVDQPAGAVEVFKSYGLPVLLIYAVFFAALFELLRRLFRNVGHGDSFTPPSVRLVQIVGGSLIVFSLVSAIGESWFAYAMYGHLVEHTQIAISGTPVQLPPADRPPWLGYESPFGSPEFFAGLLVLALAEVFRQGLALQRDNDLTV
ncbi:MAG: DUF2975 domain-containing protein [Steroidobacteraceae bacterium]